MTTKTEINSTDEGFVVVRETNIEGLLDYTQACRNELPAQRGDMQYRAEIPGGMIEGYCIAHGVTWAEFWDRNEHNKHVKRLLDENPYLYVSDKRL